ncbi:MAG: hypothetical protein K1X83_05010 [Oligoflexia bacterium]|nr:hypothetical protein [Oligoflexia bacterium]
MTGESKKIWQKVLLVFLTCLMVSCGGGSKGTGGEVLKGRLLSLTGEPQAGISVVLPTTGDQDLSNAQGDFLIQTELTEGRIEVLLEGQDFSVIVYIHDVPAGTRRIEITLVLDRHEGDVTPIIQAIKFD